MSETAKFTPGPWYYRPYNEDSGYGNSADWAGQQIMGGEEDFVLATLNHDGPNDEANARLIAAAPDMYEALQTFVSQYVDLVESGDAGFWDAEKEPKVIAARAALQKAEGHTS